MKASARALAVVLAVAVVALGGLALQKGSERVTESREGEQLVALLDYETNNDNADSAPQQQVVNGWVAKDLAIVQLNQLGDLTKAQEQTNKILALGVAAISLTGVLLMLLVLRPRRPEPQGVQVQVPSLHAPVLDPAPARVAAVNDGLLTQQPITGEILR